MYLLGYVGAALILVAVVGSTKAGQDMPPRCELKLGGNTYRTIQSEGQTRYLLKRNYLLEPRFADDCSLLQVRVFPQLKPGQSVDQGEDDTGPGLTSAEYRVIIADLNKAYPLGKVLESDTIGLSSTRGSQSWSRLEYALVEITARSTQGSNGIVYFTIYYAHYVRGQLVEKILFEESGFAKKAKILVDDKRYWTDEATYSESQLNRPGVFKVFGEPLDD